MSLKHSLLAAAAVVAHQPAGLVAGLAAGEAGINQCPPGGAEGIERLAAITGQPAQPLDTHFGIEGPVTVAVIDEDWCIGCTLCIAACPTDAIVGIAKRMHTVVEPYCTGCELCLPVCPVDCIQMVVVSGEQTGWNAWSPAQADLARARYESHLNRFEREERDQQERLATKAKAKLAALDQNQATSQAQLDEIERKRAIIAAAIARVKQSGS